MNKAQFLHILEAERAAWEDLLFAVGEEHMEGPGASGHWSVKDVVAHVTAYERWLVGWLEAASRGELPPPSELVELDVDARNAMVYERNRERPSGDVLADADAVFERLLVAVRALPHGMLTDTRHTDWFVVPYWKESRPLWRCIAGDSYEHYHQHIPDIRAWWARPTDSC